MFRDRFSADIDSFSVLIREGAEHERACRFLCRTSSEFDGIAATLSSPRVAVHEPMSVRRPRCVARDRLKVEQLAGIATFDEVSVVLHRETTAHRLEWAVRCEGWTVHRRVRVARIRSRRFGSGHRHELCRENQTNAARTSMLTGAFAP
jgi:hypothetical protein